MRFGIFSSALFVALLAASVVHAASNTFSLDEPDLISNKQLKIEGEIVLPDTPKWSAAFVLHGCDGITQWSRPVLEEHASFYRAHGFATVVLDSWQPRGLTNMCGASSPEALEYLDPSVRVADIETVTAYIARLPGFDGKIIVDGVSHGGWVALSVLSSVGDEPIYAKVAGIVAWYPACGTIDTINKTPTLIFSGGKDANPYTQASACVEAAKNFNWIETILFPEATHAFDYPYPAQVAGASGLIRYDPTAKNAAYKRIDSWLREQGLTKP
ncbi:MAG TPA: dienelactone hydrolase family protein [Parvibaculum sp.]|jgi:dienelactone hydrolase